MLTGKPDHEAIAALSPRAVAGYLLAKGWMHSREYGPYGAIFVKSEDGHEHEVLISTVNELRDFANVMAILIDDLAKIEYRSPYDILADLTLAPFDVIKVRSPDADDIGSIPLSVGVEFHEQSRHLVIAAANAAASPQPKANWRGRRFEQVDAYLGSLRLGQSQRGSFVLSLLSPWDFVPQSELGQNYLFDVLPFGRRVTEALAKALTATSRALARTVNEGVKQPFVEAVSDGVSANFCFSLAQLARDGDGVDVSVNWSLTKPGGEAVLLRLRREDAQTLTEACGALVEEEPAADATVQGVILQINNDLASFDGSVVVLAPVDGSVRRVRVRFGGADRPKVFEAGQNKFGISVKGELKARGRSLELLNPRDLVILNLTDD
jgi:hypothetical protein